VLTLWNVFGENSGGIVAIEFFQNIGSLFDRHLTDQLACGVDTGFVEDISCLLSFEQAENALLILIVEPFDNVCQIGRVDARHQIAEGCDVVNFQGGAHL